MDDLDARRNEVAVKLGMLRRELAGRGLDAIHLTSIANTAWLTAGAATYVDESVDTAACSLLVTSDDAAVLTDPIEEPRLREEEALDRLGFRFVVEPWYARGGALAAMAERRFLGADYAGRAETAHADLSATLVDIRSTLQPGEHQRLRDGSRLAAAAMWDAVRASTPGMTEHGAAAALSAASRARGGTPTVVLVASDGRIAQFRHPLPTAKAIERHVLLVLCFRYRGLVSALTRTVYFGEIPPALQRLTASVARVDATVIAATQPRRTLGEMFEVLRAAYATEGDPAAIEQHHQGGTIAYLARETLARPGSTTSVAPGQAFAWNPSMRGAKSEDTLLLTADGPEIVTTTEGWPMLRVDTPIGPLERPAILVR